MFGFGFVAVYSSFIIRRNAWLPYIISAPRMNVGIYRNSWYTHDHSLSCDIKSLLCVYPVRFPLQYNSDKLIRMPRTRDAVGRLSVCPRVILGNTAIKSHNALIQEPRSILPTSVVFNEDIQKGVGRRLPHTLSGNNRSILANTPYQHPKRKPSKQGPALYILFMWYL